MENKKLKMSDIWYYYKGYFLVAILVIVAVSYLIYIKVNEVKEDILIECVSDNCISFEACEVLKNDLNNNGGVFDSNGDGRGIAQFNSYQAGTGQNPNIDSQNTEATQVKMAVGSSAIIITDAKVISVYEGKDIFKDITYLAEEFGIQDVIKNSKGEIVGINIDNCDWFKRNNINTQGMYLTMRVPDAGLQSDEQMMKQFENADYTARYILK